MSMHPALAALGWLVGLGMAMAPLSAQAAGPAVNLVLQFRLVPEEHGPVAGAHGDVTVSTQQPQLPRQAGTGGWAIRTDPHPGDAPPALPAVVVRNGGEADVALTRWRLAPQWRWKSWMDDGSSSDSSSSSSSGSGSNASSGTTSTRSGMGSGSTSSSGRGSSGSSGMRMGLEGGEVPLAQQTHLKVAPQWSGGRSPVALRYEVRWPLNAGEGARPGDEASFGGSLWVPLGQWTVVGRLGGSSAAVTGSSWSTGGTQTWRTQDAEAPSEADQRLEVRILHR
jgi:hypothetical protein